MTEVFIVLACLIPLGIYFYVQYLTNPAMRPKKSENIGTKGNFQPQFGANKKVLSESSMNIPRQNAT